MPIILGLEPGLLSLNYSLCFWIYAGENIDLEEYGTNYYSFKLWRFIKKKKN